MAVVLAVLVCLAVGGCQPAGEQEKGTGLQPPEFARVYTQDQLSLRLSIAHQRITSAQRLQLTLEATSAENYAVAFPAAGDDFGDFAVVGLVKSDPFLTEEGMVAVQQSYTLEPSGPGKLTIPALLVSSWQKDLEEAPVTELKTEAVPVTVDSLLPENAAEATLSDIAPPVAQPWNMMVLLAAGLGFLLLLALCWYFWRRRARKADLPPPPLPPHLLAYQALDLLVGEGLVESGQLKLFYEKVSTILREYIEHRFGLNAPERTTEEFLAELGGAYLSASRRPAVADPALRAHRGLLQDFLSQCDLVKFAKHHPHKGEVEESVALCRQFIAATEPVAAQPAQQQALDAIPPPAPETGKEGAL